MAFSRVLAATDFSRDSVRTARLALAIARRQGAQFTLLHVDTVPPFGRRMAEHVGADVWQAYLDERNAVLGARVTELAADLGPGPVDVALARDDPATAIVHWAVEHRADLIVISPHGRNSSTFYLLGGVAFDVAGSARCPVLVARHSAEFRVPEDGSFRRPLLAFPNEGASEDALRVAAALAAPNASIDLMHVIEPRELLAGPPLPAAAAQTVVAGRSAVRAALKHSADWLRKDGFEASIHMEKGDATSILLEPLTAKLNDVVIVGTRSPRRSGALGKVTQRLLRYSPVPVAVVPRE